MSLALFISKKLIGSKGSKKKISATIIFIAQIAVALGIVVTLLTISIGVGFRQSIKERLSGFNGHVLVTTYEANSSFESSALHQVDSLTTILNRMSDIDLFQKVVIKSGIIKTDSLYEGVVMKGVGTDFNREVYQDYLVQGKIPQFGKQNDSILLSERIAKNLYLGLGDKLYMYFIRDEKPVVRSFYLAGLYNTGIKEIDKNIIIGDIEHVRRLNRWKNKEVGAIEVYVKNINDLQKVSDIIFDEVGPQYYAENAFQLNPQIISWVELFDVNMVVIIGVIFLVVAINIIMALLILIIDRTPMIGTLKALGATNWQIRKIFLYNAIFILSFGLLVGNGIAITLLLLQKYFGIVTLDPDFYYVEEVPVYLNVFYILVVNGIAIILCALVLIIPTYVISKIPPIKAIKFR
ncbi:MAG: ABC transporter permease [Flavobacteriales bacterium]